MNITWWKVGFIGAFTLTLATIAKLFKSLHAVAAGTESLADVGSFVGIIFAIGFACGLSVWLVLPLAERGMFGLAAIGFITMNFFFLACMLAFEPTLLSPNPGRAVPMFAFASVLGPFAGVVIGRSIREEWKKAQDELQRENDRFEDSE